MQHSPCFPHFSFRVSLVLFALTAFLAACGSSASTSGASSTTTGVNNGGPNGGGTTSACTPGNVIINTISTEVFCGPAQAHVTIGGQTYIITNGACFSASAGTGVNIGHEVLDVSNSAAAQALKAQYAYFGALAQASKDGTYPNSTIAGNHQNVDFTASGTITLSNNLQAGTFTGTTILGNQTISGSWTC